MNLLVSKWIRSCEGGGEEVMPACHVGTALETWSSSGGGSLRHCWIPGGCEALLICWNKLLCKKCRWALCDSKQNVIRCVLVDSSEGTQKPLPQIAILASSLTLSWKEQGGYMCWVGWGGIMFTVVTDCHRVICSLFSTLEIQQPFLSGYTTENHHHIVQMQPAHTGAIFEMSCPSLGWGNCGNASPAIFNTCFTLIK